MKLLVSMLLVAGALCAACGKSTIYRNEPLPDASDADADMDTDADADSDTDSDSDSDSDVDTESDTSTDTGLGPKLCGEVPLICSDIATNKPAQRHGCCWNDVLYYCVECETLVEEEGWPWSGECYVGQMVLRHVHCNDFGFGCYYSAEQDQMACVGDGDWSCGFTPTECEDFGPEIMEQHVGCCVGDSAYFSFFPDEQPYYDVCEVHVDDCADEDLECGYDYGPGAIRCI